MESKFIEVFLYRVKLEEPKLFIDWYVAEDLFFTIKPLAAKRNPKRRKFLALKLGILSICIRLKIKYKHVGWLYYGKNKKKVLDK